MVFQKMSKNYSLIEIKSLLENIQDEIFSILLDSSSNSNSHYFQNFTGISLKTIKYLNHYLNVLNHDEKIGSILSYIYQQMQRSFNDYKSRNIYFQSCLYSPLAQLAQDEDEQKQQDQIYHFMNTRNSNIPLQILANPDHERQRMELALFVENMTKKKITLKEPKRSLQLPQQHQMEIKIIRKATYDPTFRPMVQEEHQSHVQLQKIKENEQVQVQTQTDCIMNEYEAQTQKQQDELKSQAQSCFKSQIVLATLQNIEDSVKKKNKANIKNKKKIKVNDIKSNQKKKKAQIACSIKENDPSAAISLKTSQKEIKNQKKSDKQISLKRQCSIKVLCGQREAIQLSSKEVNVVYSKEYFKIIQNQVQEKSILLQIQNRNVQANNIQELKTKTANELTGKKIMEVIAQSMEEYNHPELKSEQSSKSSMLNGQIGITISRAGGENLISNNQTRKLSMTFNKQMRKSQITPIDSIQYDKDSKMIKKNNEGNQKHSVIQNRPGEPSSSNKRQSLLTSNKNQIVRKQSLKELKQQHIKQQKDNVQKGFTNCIQQNKGQKQLQLNCGITTLNNENQVMALKHLQNSEDSHLTPIKQINTNNNQRFSKLNVTKSKMEYMSRRLQKKYMHSTDYLDKFVRKQDLTNNKQFDYKDKQFEARNITKKGSLFVINNRNKIVQQKTDNNKQKETLSVNQPTRTNKTKVKLANIFKLGFGQKNQKLNAQHQSNNLNRFVQKEPLNISCDVFQNLKTFKSSVVKLQTQEKELRPHKSVLRNKKIAQSCHIANTQSQYHLIARQLRQKNKRQLIRQYLDLIQTSHKKFCGQRCAHIENLYKKVNFDGSAEEDIIEQLLRLIKKGK